jgi:hypothetical protein
MFSQRFPRGGPRKLGDGTPLPPWMLAIHAANRIEKIFGQPDITGQREGVGYVEEYVDADVIFPDADPLTVKIVAKTELGDRVLKQAVAALEVGT